MSREKSAVRFFDGTLAGGCLGIGEQRQGCLPPVLLSGQRAVRLGMGDRTSQAKNYHPLPHYQTAHPCCPADASLDVTGHGRNSAKVRAGTSLFSSGLRP